MSRKKSNLLISFLYIFVVLQSSLSSSQFCSHPPSWFLHWRCCWYALKCNLYYWFNLVNWFLLSSQLAFYLSYTISCLAIEPHSSLYLSPSRLSYPFCTPSQTQSHISLSFIHSKFIYLSFTPLHNHNKWMLRTTYTRAHTHTVHQPQMDPVRHILEHF